MKTIILAISALAAPGLACAGVPAGPDPLNGAFARMLDHQPVRLEAVRPAGDDAVGLQFEQFVNAVARGDKSSLDLGFSHMLARADDVPPALTVHGERDPVERLVTSALQAQALGIQSHAGL